MNEQTRALIGFLNNSPSCPFDEWQKIQHEFMAARRDPCLKTVLALADASVERLDPAILRDAFPYFIDALMSYRDERPPVQDNYFWLGADAEVA